MQIITQKKGILAIKLFIMRVVFILLICFGCIPIYAQKGKDRLLLKEGSYSYGHYKGNPDKTQFWYIKKDSTFINFYVFNDYNIRAIRMGKWQYLGDSMISFLYVPLKSTLLLNSTIDYHAETKGSSDSVYFYGSVKGSDNKPLPLCGLVFDNLQKEFARFGVAVGYGFTGGHSDANGNFGFTTPKNRYFGSIGIAFTPDYYPLTINTFPGNNYHTLTITVPLKDSSNDIDISKFDFRPEVFKYRPSKPGQNIRVRSGDLLINYITKEKTLLLDVLNEARKKQPYLVGPIDELIEYLRK
ncbi:MAG: hypothetical protein ABI685_03415 [Ferruginibacter sp.]